MVAYTFNLNTEEQRQEDLLFQAQHGLHSQFQDSRDYTNILSQQRQKVRRKLESSEPIKLREDSAITTLDSCLMIGPCRGHQENLYTKKEGFSGGKKGNKTGKLWVKITKVHQLHI